MLKRDEAGEAMLLNEMGIDLEGDDSGVVSKCIFAGECSEGSGRLYLVNRPRSAVAVLWSRRSGFGAEDG